jgi:malate synthase
MDGAWTGHPDQNAIAVAQFPAPNQLGRIDDVALRPDLRPPVRGVGQTTTEGTRAAVRTVIRYRHGYLSGKGASLLDGYMEDLATDRIYRLMIAQRIRHGMHTAREVSDLFDAELAALVAQVGTADADVYRSARAISEAMIARGEADPV